VAIANNYYNDVKKLLEKGVNGNCRYHNGISAIEIAQYMKYDDIVKLLVDHGATGGLPGYSSSSSAAAGGGGSLRKHSRKQSSRKKSRKNCRH
jgi:ankyrin repeat protein